MNILIYNLAKQKVYTVFSSIIVSDTRIKLYHSYDTFDKSIPNLEPIYINTLTEDTLLDFVQNKKINIILTNTKFGIKLTDGLKNNCSIIYQSSTKNIIQDINEYINKNKNIIKSEPNETNNPNEINNQNETNNNPNEINNNQNETNKPVIKSENIARLFKEEKRPIKILAYNISKNILHNILLGTKIVHSDIVIYHNYLNPSEYAYNLKDFNYINYNEILDDNGIINLIEQNEIHILLTNVRLSSNSQKNITNKCIIMENSNMTKNAMISKIVECYNSIQQKSLPKIKPNEKCNETNEKCDKNISTLNTNITVNSNKDNNYLSHIEEYSKIMDISQNEIFSNFKQEFRYFCFRYMDYMRNIDLPIINQNNNFEAVLIEYRCLPHLEFLIRNCIDKLGEKWSQTIVCGNLNYHYMMNIVKSIDRDIKVIKTDYDNLNQTGYSLLLSSEDFWNLLVGEKILIYQEDTCIFKYNIENFIKWDYIGAPWLKEQNDTQNCVGNGGLSLRSKSCMLQVINKINITKTKYNSSTLNYMNSVNLTIPPEDVYFSKNMQELNIGTVADWDSAYNFSSESIINDNSFGGHGIWCRDTNKMKEIMYKNVVKTFDVSRDFNVLTDHRGGWNIVKHKLKNMVNLNSDILFLDMVDIHFLLKTNEVINKKWFGFMHITPVTPSYVNWININTVFDNTNFVKSLKNCLYIITLSNYITNFLKKKMLEIGYFNIQIFTIFHPTDIDVPLFDFNKYKKNKDKKIIQIGQQLRKVSSIYRLNTSFKKVWLTGFKDQKIATNILNNEINIFGHTNVNINSVDKKYITNYHEYDELLSANIAFIDLFDAGANNAVVECIARNTPLIVNKLEGVVDYLGENYPLYFNNLDEVPNLLNDEKIEQAYNYLKDLNKDYLNVNKFTKDFINILHQNVTKQNFTVTYNK